NATGIEITTVFVGFAGESYADIPTVVETVGYLNPATREERVKKTERISDFARDLGVNKVAAHVGFVPEEPNDPNHEPMVESVGRVADYCAKNAQLFSLETGQETAPALLHFLQILKRDNVKVNFDPANMILYGSGEPIEALGIVADHVISVHAKDGTWPTAEGQLGTEYPLGQGDVGMDRFVAKLKEIGYRGPLTIEREISDWGQKVKDLVAAKKLLESLF
ncbi:MAG: sugar phosphate isomerase/epimerase, partial [bacterium]|nr:sugar phosphate isomerase/epimerase [bacterium]